MNIKMRVLILGLTEKLKSNICYAISSKSLWFENATELFNVLIKLRPQGKWKKERVTGGKEQNHI